MKDSKGYLHDAVFWIVFILGFLCPCNGDLSYSVPEEMKKGSVFGNIAKDLGVSVKGLSDRKARIDMESNDKRFCNLQDGELVILEIIDREELCGSQPSCSLNYEFVLENPLELHRIFIQIEDINDNSPRFPNNEIKLEIRESAIKGSRFPLDEAHDADMGRNGIQSYSLDKNEHFALAVHSNSDGGKYSELILDTELDREQEEEVTLVLTATDGGTPQRSGTTRIHVTVLDANDNLPVFSQPAYIVSLPENAPLDTVVVTVSATDADEGANGEVTYEFSRISDKAAKLFSIDKVTGEIKVVGQIDYEEKSKYELRVQAKDGAGLVSQAKINIDITDVNDNAPVISIKSLNAPIPENVGPCHSRHY